MHSTNEIRFQSRLRSSTTNSNEEKFLSEVDGAELLLPMDSLLTVHRLRGGILYSRSEAWVRTSYLKAIWKLDFQTGNVVNLKWAVIDFCFVPKKSWWNRKESLPVLASSGQAVSQVIVLPSSFISGCMKVLMASLPTEMAAGRGGWMKQQEDFSIYLSVCDPPLLASLDLAFPEYGRGGRGN